MTSNNIIHYNCRSVYILLSVFLLIFQCVIFFLDKGDGQETLYWIFFVITGIQLFVYYFTGIRKDKEIFTFWIRPSNILILSLLIVNLQILLNSYLGLESISTYLGTDKYSQYTGKTLIFGCIGINAFLLGNTFKLRRKCFNSNYTSDGIVIWALLSACAFIGWFINIDLLSFITGMDYQGSGAADRQSSSFSIFETLFDVFVTITLSIITRNNLLQCRQNWSVISFLKTIPIYFLVVVGIYMTLRLLSGDRGQALYMGLMFFFSYIIVSGRRMKLISIILLVSVGAFSMTTLNVVRSFRNPNESFGQKVERAFTSMSEMQDVRTICPFTHELANSVNCNFIALHDIDKGATDYKLGAYNACGLLIGIPGSNRISQALFDLNMYRYATSEYVTISYFGENYPLGLGTTVLVDFYLDFGIIGVILGMILVGFIYKFVDSCITKQTTNVYLIIIILKFASMAIYIPRASLAFVGCRIIYISLVYLVICFVFKPFRKFSRRLI